MQYSSATLRHIALRYEVQRYRTDSTAALLPKDRQSRIARILQYATHGNMLPKTVVQDVMALNGMTVTPNAAPHVRWCRIRIVATVFFQLRLAIVSMSNLTSDDGQRDRSSCQWLPSDEMNLRMQKAACRSSSSVLQAHEWSLH